MRLGREDRRRRRRISLVSTSIVRRLLVLAAVALPASAVVADVTIPSTGAPPAPMLRPKSPPAPMLRPKSILTRWPAVLPCPQPRDLVVRRTYSEDVLLWSNSRDDRVSEDGARPIPPGFLRDPPHSIAWTRNGPEKWNGGEMPMPIPHSVELNVKCGDDRWSEISWECSYDQASCSLRAFYRERDPDVLRRYRADRARVQQIMRAGAGARDLLIADALHLVQDACAGDRCSDVVARAASRLRAAATQPPWKVTRPDGYRLELTAPGAPDKTLSCNDDPWIDHVRKCTLTLGTLSFEFPGDSHHYGFLSGDTNDDTWWLTTSGDGYTLMHEAAR
jgi:hypothetical protein